MGEPGEHVTARTAVKENEVTQVCIKSLTVEGQDHIL